MIRSQINNLIIALGLVFIYSAAGNILSDIRQVASSKSYLPVEQDIVEAAAFEITETLEPEEPEATSTPFPPPAAAPTAVFRPVEAAEVMQTAPTELPQASPTPEPTAVPEAPVRLVIESISLEAPVVEAPAVKMNLAGKKYQYWQVPDEYAAGWHEYSARLGESGNTVLSGHHNVYGEVFRRLVDLKEGDEIVVYSGTKAYTYLITNKMILPEKYEELDVRMENARWILPSDDERLTLITCWPYESNTHRLILVAIPK